MDKEINKLEFFVNAYNRKKLSHAYLLNGELYGGQLLLAYDISKFLLCEDNNKHETKKSCGQCNSCRMFDAGTHPDFTFVCSQEKKTVISVDQVREIINKAYKKPYYGKYSIFVIDECTNMNQSGHNALLKILEEPPEYVLFFMTTSKKNQLLDTIISRVTTLNVSSRDIFSVHPELENIDTELKKHCLYMPEIMQIVLKEDNGEFYTGSQGRVLKDYSSISKVVTKTNIKKMNENTKLLYRVILLRSFFDDFLRNIEVYKKIGLINDMFQKYADLSTGKILPSELYSLTIKCLKARLLIEEDSFIIGRIFGSLKILNEFETLVNVNFNNVFCFLALNMEDV